MNPLDIVITFHIKDEKNLKFTINSIRKNILHSKIFIITNFENYDIINNLKCVFINENIIGEDLYNNIIKENRGGWYLQQILKLFAHNFVSTENYLVIDADTVILKKIDFFEDNFPLLVVNNQIFYPYFNVIKYLLNITNELNFSFISHHMVFNKNIVKQLINEIEFHSKTTWINAIVNILYKKNQNISFSEFETYGNYIISKNIKFKFRNLHTIDLPIKPNYFFIKLYSFRYDIISFHNYSWTNNKIIDRILKYIKYIILFFR